MSKITHRIELTDVAPHELPTLVDVFATADGDPVTVTGGLEAFTINYATHDAELARIIADRLEVVRNAPREPGIVIGPGATNSDLLEQIVRDVKYAHGFPTFSMALAELRIRLMKEDPSDD